MIDVDEVEFYDPHPGMMGCLTPLPRTLVLAAKAMENTRGTIEQGIGLLEAAANHEGVVTAHDLGFISLRLTRPDGAIDSWRLIRFRREGGNA